MCGSSPSYTPPATIETPPAPPEPAETAKLDTVTKVDNAGNSTQKKKQGRSALRVQRQTGLGGATTAGVSMAN